MAIRRFPILFTRNTVINLTKRRLQVLRTFTNVIERMLGEKWKDLCMMKQKVCKTLRMQKNIFTYPILMLINFDEPLIVMMMGLPGSGKSYMARLLKNANGYSVLSTDRIRREIGLQGDYSAESVSSVYVKLAEAAAELLKEEISVILDATFSKKAYRTLCYEKLMAYPIHIFECRVRREQTIIERIKKRISENSSYSEADIEVYKMQRKLYEPIYDDELNHFQSKTIFFND